jgi:hypothetical protein
MHKMKRMTPMNLSLSAKDQATLDHLIELSIVGKLNLAYDGQDLHQYHPNQDPERALTSLDSSQCII